MDWLPYLEFAAPFLPWKAAGKFLLSHTLSLCVGLSAFLVSQTINLSRRKAEGEAVMTPSQLKIPSWFDYLIAHPLTLPLWLWALLSTFLTLIPVSFLAGIPLILFLWLRLYQQSLIVILEYHSAEETKEVLPCVQLART